MSAPPSAGGPGDCALRLSHVSKRFGDFIAVGDLSFEVPAGCVYGLLGPNGAGKTTTLRMINDILLPDEGSIEVLGSMVPGPEAATYIGYLPEERGLYPKMKVAEILAFFATLRGLSVKEASRQADLWLERLSLSDWRRHSVQDLSKGMQQKVQFAVALIHDPQLLILDEPWSGLDPINADVLKDIVVSQKRAGKTIMFSTHLMEQAESICDYVCIMAKGRKAVEGPLAELKREAASSGLILLAFSGEGTTSLAEKSILVGPMVTSYQQRRDGLLVQLAAGVESAQFLGELLVQKLPIRRFEIQQASLHEIFVSRVGAMADAEKEGRLASSAEAASEDAASEDAASEGAASEGAKPGGTP